MNERESVRAFLAVPPDPEWSASARELVDDLRPRLPQASWTRPESWHLTLRFLGDVASERLAALSAALGRLSAGRSGAVLSTRGPVVFPPRGPARVLAVELEPDAELSALAEAAEGGARETGLPPETRPFRPHVTFARIRRPWSAGAVALFIDEARRWTFPLWPVQTFVRYESELASGGAVHTPRETWALPARAGGAA
jgi:2'-5' RNA ligase